MGKEHLAASPHALEEAGKRDARADEAPIAAGVKSSAQTGRSGQKESASAAVGAKGDLEVPFAIPEGPTPGTNSARRAVVNPYPLIDVQVFVKYRQLGKEVWVSRLTKEGILEAPAPIPDNSGESYLMRPD